MLLDTSEIERLNFAAVKSSEQANKNIALMRIAVDFLSEMTREQSFSSDDEVTILRLGIRVLNDAGAASQCAMSGYYQQAVGIIRDIIEVGFLLDLFRREKAKIAEWRTCTPKERKDNFKIVDIRKRLDLLDGTDARKRQEAYAFYSTHGTHPTPDLQAISPGGDTMIGPFPHDGYARLITYDLAKWFVAAVGYIAAILDFGKIPSDRRLTMSSSKLRLGVEFAGWLSTPQQE